MDARGKIRVVVGRRLQFDVTQAACRDSPVNFYPAPGERALDAKLLCKSCPLIDPCAEHGIHFEQFGVWGGLTESERDKIRRRRKLSQIA